jgi:hypothetical protein
VTARFFKSSSSSSWWLPTLSSSSSSNRLLRGGHSRDDTANIFLHHVVREFKQHIMMTSANGATGALSMGPSAGYNSILKFVKFNIIFFAMISMSLVFVYLLTCIYMLSQICYGISRLNLGSVWFEVLKFNKHCSTFVLFDKNFSILD